MDELLSGIGASPVVEQVLSPCPSLHRHALRLRSFVAGEFQDEDGDFATQFILADPPPHASSSSSAPVVEVIYLSEDDDVDVDDDEAVFYCDLCLQHKPLHSVFLLTCSCLFCRPCLQAHVESVFVKEASQIGSQLNEGSSDQTIDLTREPLESVSCPNAECSGWVSLSSAQQLAPEAFRMWEEAVNEAFFTENAAFVKCPGCDMVFEKMTGVLPPGVALTGVPELDRTAPSLL